MKLLSLLLVVVFSASTASVASAAHVWTDRKGRQVEADLVAVGNGKVTIRRTSDGKSFDVPLDSLSDSDQAFIRSQPPPPSSPQPIRPASPQNQIPGRDDARERFVEKLAAQWAMKALSLRLQQTTEVIELSLSAQEGSVELRMARCLASAHAELTIQEQLELERLTLELRNRAPKELYSLEAKAEALENKGFSKAMVEAQLSAEMARMALTAKCGLLDGETNPERVKAAEMAKAGIAELERKSTEAKAGITEQERMVGEALVTPGKAIAKAEQLFNEMMTPELAANLVQSNLIKVGALTKEHQTAMNGFELRLNELITPSRAAFLVKASHALEKAKTKELEASRARVRDLLRKAIAQDANAEKAIANAAELIKQSASDKLLQSRKQVEARIEESRKK